MSALKNDPSRGIGREAMAMAEETPSRLGRGLAALIGEDTAFALGDKEAPAPKGVREVPIEFLRANLSSRAIPSGRKISKILPIRSARRVCCSPSSCGP